MKIKKTIAVFLACITLGMTLGGCSGGGSSSSSSQTYTCGYCGRTMKGGYYDYINGKYACRSCSKERRG